jgi:hypothetical protein
MIKQKSSFTGVVRILIFILFIFSPNTIVLAQKVIESTDPETRIKWYDQHVKMKENSLFKNWQWQFVGPTNVSGRMTDVAVVAPKGKHYTIYVAGASGGVWKTENEGITWKPVFEHAPSVLPEVFGKQKMRGSPGNRFLNMHRQPPLEM